MTAQADKPKPIGYQAEIYVEAYKTLRKYKEVELIFEGPIKVWELAPRPFNKADHGLTKPRSLEGWMVPVSTKFESKDQLWLTFKVEVLDLPKLGNVAAITEIHSIIGRCWRP